MAWNVDAIAQLLRGGVDIEQATRPNVLRPLLEVVARRVDSRLSECRSGAADRCCRTRQVAVSNVVTAENKIRRFVQIASRKFIECGYEAGLVGQPAAQRHQAQSDRGRHVA